MNTADDNYIAARWCFVERLNVDFFWLAVHALEKYMKAVLLVNGRSGKGFIDQANSFQPYGHDIEALYQNVQALAPDLLPSKLQKPNRLETDRWREEVPKAFMARFHRNGNADNRYQVFGYVRHDDDLFKLDAMVFALRRLCMPLDAYYLGKHRPGKPNLTHRNVLTKQPELWALTPHCRLKKTADGKRGDRLREVLLNLNLPFAPDDFEHTGLRSGMAAANPVLARLILNPLAQQRNSKAVASATQLRDWVIDNIKLPHAVTLQLTQATATPKP